MTARGERLFFALVPGTDVADGIDRVGARAVAACADPGVRKIPRDNLHLTLLFLGAVSPVDRDRLVQWLADFQAPAFTLTLDTLGRFGASDSLWLAPARPPEALMALVTAIHGAGDPVTDADTTRAFKPHVTLARKARSTPDIELNPLHWSVRDCALMRSEPVRRGVRYTVVARSRSAVK